MSEPELPQPASILRECGSYCEAHYFFDTEYSQDGDREVELISIGVVCDDGREFYAVSNEYDEKAVSHWVRRYVVRRLGKDIVRMTNREIAEGLKAFIGEHPEPKFFAKGADTHDWKMLCEMFGGEENLPLNFPRAFEDVNSLWRQLESPELPPHPGNKHNALADAHWTRAIWNFLTELALQQEAG